MDELDELNERIYRAQGWEKLQPPAYPQWQRPGPNGVEVMYAPRDYARDIAAAYELLEDAYAYTVTGPNLNKSKKVEAILYKAGNPPHGWMGRGDRLPEAISRAWLAWKEGQE